MNDKNIRLNEEFWDKEAIAMHPWSVPVSSEIIASAKEGDWNVHVTKKPIPASWLPKDIKNKNIPQLEGNKHLCLQQLELM